MTEVDQVRSQKSSYSLTSVTQYWPLNLFYILVIKYNSVHSSTTRIDRESNISFPQSFLKLNNSVKY